MKIPLSIKQLVLTLGILLMTAAACPRTTAQPTASSDAVTAAMADTVEVMSQAMGRNIKSAVIFPAQYHDSVQQTYPVIYLLHGAEGQYNDWPRRANLDSLATCYGVIIVCPDGQDSWYLDSPVDPAMQFETFVSKELVAYIDSHYRTRASRYMRAITGLSMGGHGALFLAFRHPDVFWSCGSMSGCMDITQFPDRWHIKDRLGDYESNKQRWREHAVCNLVGQLPDNGLTPAQNIIIDDGLNDIFIKNNIALHEQLVQLGINHDFTVRPGRHNWKYWVNSLDYHLLFFNKAFARGATLMEQ